MFAAALQVTVIFVLAALLDDLASRDAQAAGDVDADAAAGVFRYAMLSSILEEIRLRVPHLGSSTSRQQSRHTNEFRQADKGHLRSNAARVRYLVARHLRKVRDAEPEQSRLVREQAARQRRHMALRKLIEKAPDVLMTARPCWAMSPVIVSRVLPPKQLFDVVIFDEASQVAPQDAITSIMRGRQIVVAGDPLQLPPSPFFKRVLAGTSGMTDETEEQSDDLTVYQSILERLSPLLSRFRTWLNWHYRSTDERLIAFSNTEIYGGTLTTFPGISRTAPISLEVVDGTVLPGQSGSAPEEVEAVVRLALAHARERREESLGIITLGDKHAQRIEAKLRAVLRDHPQHADFFSNERGPGRRVFIKSLESVQGDERDAIILSIGKAKTAVGGVSLQLGALTREDGHRRLNVAVTRARNRITVVSSFSSLRGAPTADAAGKAQRPGIAAAFS